MGEAEGDGARQGGGAGISHKHDGREIPVLAEAERFEGQFGMGAADLMGEDVRGRVVCPAEFRLGPYPGAGGEGATGVEKALGIRVHNRAFRQGLAGIGLAQFIAAGIGADHAANEAVAGNEPVPDKDDRHRRRADGEAGELVLEAALVQVTVSEEGVHGGVVERFRHFSGDDDAGVDLPGVNHGGDDGHAVQDAEAGVRQVENGAVFAEPEHFMDEAGGGWFKEVAADRGVDAAADAGAVDAALTEGAVSRFGGDGGRAGARIPEPAFVDAGHKFETAGRQFQPVVDRGQPGLYFEARHHPGRFYQGDGGDGGVSKKQGTILFKH